MVTNAIPLAPRLLAREAVRVRQVLIDIAPNPASGAAPFAQDLAAALKEKVNKALLDCHEDRNLPPSKTHTVTQLRNGGILLEFVSDAAAVWFACGETCQNFLKKLHPKAVIKPHGYHIVVQFIPLILRPNKEVDL